MLQHRSALVHRELLLVEVQRHALVQSLLQGLLFFQVSMFSEYSLGSYVVRPTKKLDNLVNLRWRGAGNVKITEMVSDNLTNSLLC